jgi:hypothetical protein
MSGEAEKNNLLINEFHRLLTSKNSDDNAQPPVARLRRILVWFKQNPEKICIYFHWMLYCR